MMNVPLKESSKVTMVAPIVIGMSEIISTLLENGFVTS